MSDLNVVLVHFNPRRLKVRTRLFLDAAARLERDGAKVWRVEAAFADRPHEVTSRFNRRHLQLRTCSEVWNKEALVNAGADLIFRRSPNAKYLSWIDADLEFVRPDWVSETICALEHHPAVQMFSDAIDLNPRFGFMGRAHGFARLWTEGQRPGDFERNKVKYPTHMHPGYAWGFRANVWRAIGGMPTFGVLGSGDHQMACGLVGLPDECCWPDLHPAYHEAIRSWSRKAFDVVQADIGYVDGQIHHHFHGFKENRGYSTRIGILKTHQFDPSVDLQFDHHGLPHLVGKPALRMDVAAYMGSRKEYDLTTALEQPVKGRQRPRR